MNIDQNEYMNRLHAKVGSVIMANEILQAEAAKVPALQAEVARLEALLAEHKIDPGKPTPSPDGSNWQ